VRISASTGNQVMKYLNEDIDTIQRPRIRSNQSNAQTVSGPVKIKATNWMKLGSKNGSNSITFNSGADANLSAVNSIKFLPGSKAVKGAKLKAKVGASVSKKSDFNTVQPAAVSYPITSPYIGKVVSYNDSVEQPNGIVEEHQVERNVCIFPNPSGGIVNVELSNENQSTGLLVVSDIYGKVIVSRKVNASKTQLDLSGFPNGIYFVSLNQPGANYKEKIILNK
ncbi:MAG TPA: T9SS type A sorting domain-containing protein, partial [Bacteroidales bacterium]